MNAKIERYEKYRIGYDWLTTLVVTNDSEGRRTAQQFAVWFAESDWDDPRAAWKEYRQR